MNTRERLGLPALPPAPDLMDILGGVQEDIADFIDGLRDAGPAYARAYAEWYATRNRANAPALPAGLRPEAAAAIRESVADRAMAARCRGAIEAEPRRAARDRAAREAIA